MWVILIWSKVEVNVLFEVQSGLLKTDIIMSENYSVLELLILKMIFTTSTNLYVMSYKIRRLSGFFFIILCRILLWYSYRCIKSPFQNKHVLIYLLQHFKYLRSILRKKKTLRNSLWYANLKVLVGPNGGVS